MRGTNHQKWSKGKLSDYVATSINPRLFFSILTAGLLYGQDTATIVGSVTDPSGAAIADAQVTLVNTATQFTRVVQTGSSGEYVASAIPTGAYVITVVKQGFEKLERSGA